MIHPDDTTFAEFVIGALEDDTEFVTHVAACEECSSKLQREATLELSLMEVRADQGCAVAKDVEVAPPKKTRRLWMLAPAAILPLAAAAAFLLSGGRISAKHDDAAIGASRVAHCADGPNQADCIVQAHRDGARIEYPRTSFAKLGTVPGLTISVEWSATTERMEGLDAILDQVRPPLHKCLEDTLPTVQTAPVQSGHFNVSLSLSAEGIVIDSGVGLRRVGPRRGINHQERALIECVPRAFGGMQIPVAPNRPIRADAEISYIWRE